MRIPRITQTNNKYNSFFIIAIIALFAGAIDTTSRGATVDPDSKSKIGSAASIAPLIEAMRVVESNDNPQAIGDHGRSIGALQIKRGYWRDSGIGGTYRQCTNTAYATKCVIAYWQRYAIDALRNGDYKTLAMIHNGGPNGATKASAMLYWRKIEAAL